MTVVYPICIIDYKYNLRLIIVLGTAMSGRKQDKGWFVQFCHKGIDCKSKVIKYTRLHSIYSSVNVALSSLLLAVSA